ncbi:MULTISPECIES: lytic transglycosylase domain-containing protein [Chelativorans]|jgi:hypothetical protein|nr:MULTISPECIES: lytic transglycosylase domain-containing protein [Chelativorans]
MALVPAAVLASCAGGSEKAQTVSEGQQAATPPARVTVARWDGVAGADGYTRLALDAVRRNGSALVSNVPEDVSRYCPGYEKANADDRASFWVGLLSALAKWESNFKPAVTFTEPDIYDASGNNVISRGLLQLSFESANAYGCGLRTADDLHDPGTNLTCGVKILSRLVTRSGVIASDGRPWRGAAAYWSPFRDQAKRADIQSWTSRQSYCSQVVAGEGAL